MTTMGLYEVRAHLSELVDQVAKRKKVLITLPPPCLVRLLRRAGRMCAKSSRRCWQFGTARDRRWAASLPFGSQSTEGAASRSTRDTKRRPYGSATHPRPNGVCPPSLRERAPSTRGSCCDGSTSLWERRERRRLEILVAAGSSGSISWTQGKDAE